MRPWLPFLVMMLVSSVSRAANPAHEVAAALQELNQAFESRDVAKVRALLAPQHVAITPFAGQQTLEEQLRTLPELKYDKYSPGPLQTTTVSETCVTVTSELKARGTFQGQPLPGKCLVSAVWVKSGDQWRELQYHETVVREVPAPDKTLLTELTNLERQSWEATLRDDLKFFESFLAEEAVGMLADGSLINRQQIIQNLADIHLKKSKMGQTVLLRAGGNAALILDPASSEAVHKGVDERFAAVNGSALSVRRAGKWRQLFSQETPTGGSPAAPKPKPTP